MYDNFYGGNVGYRNKDAMNKVFLPSFFMAAVPLLCAVCFFVVFELFTADKVHLIISSLCIAAGIGFITFFAIRKFMFSLMDKVRWEILDSHQNIDDDGAIDEKTGLYTDAYLTDILREELVRAAYYQRPCSLMILDVDELQKYRDKFGEEKKKYMIEQIIRIIKKHTPIVGKIAISKYGEFMVLLPETNKKEVISFAEILRSEIEHLELSDGLDDRITVSIGLSENPIDGINEDEIIDKARKNVKTAKERGRNQVVADQSE